MEIPNLLVLTGEQVTDVWVDSQIINNLHILFYRTGYKQHNVTIPKIQNILLMEIENISQKHSKYASDYV